MLLVIVAFVLSFATAWTIVQLSERKGRFVSETGLQGIQAFHKRPVARIEGVSVFIGFSAATLLLADQ